MARKCIFCGRITKTRDGAFRHLLKRHQKEIEHAAQARLKPQGDIGQHPHRAEGGSAAEASGGDRAA
jgi:hypothetical protein